MSEEARKRTVRGRPIVRVDPETDEMGQFTELTRGLLQVPKEELDEKLREHRERDDEDDD